MRHKTVTGSGDAGRCAVRMPVLLWDRLKLQAAGGLPAGLPGRLEAEVAYLNYFNFII